VYRVPFECLRFRFGGGALSGRGAGIASRCPPPAPGLSFSLFNLSPLTILTLNDYTPRMETRYKKGET
jgi:hypothetical protein